MISTQASKKLANKWFLAAFISLIVLLSSSAYWIITITANSQKTNLRGAFESTLWAALQLQLQYYRLTNFIIQIPPEELPLQGQAHSEYSQLMSRIDLLREGEVSNVIRFFEEGRPMRLLYLINGELELLSHHIDRLEAGDLTQIPILLRRLESTGEKINEFVILINQGSNAYAVSLRNSIEGDLDTIAWLMWLLIIVFILVTLLIIRLLKQDQQRQQDWLTVQEKLTSVTTGKVRFLNMLKQELTIPTNGILGMTAILQRSRLPERQYEMLNTISNSGNTILSTLDTFTDLAALEADNLAIHFSSNDLQQVVQTTSDAIYQNPMNHNIKLYSYVDWYLPNIGFFDLHHLKRLITLLLENACRQANEGNITLVIRRAPVQASYWRPQIGQALEATILQIVVQDKGQSLTDTQQQALRQGLHMETDNRQKYLAGMHLSLCYQLASKMGGKLNFTSQQDIGSEFWLDIPMYHEKNSLPIQETSIITTQIAFLKDKKVCLIETDEQVSHLIRMQVASLGMNTVFTSDRLSSPLSVSVDIIIITNDAYLEVNAYHYLHQLNRKNIPIIVTNTTSKATQKIATAVIAYPFSQLNLLKHLQTSFGLHD